MPHDCGLSSVYPADGYATGHDLTRIGTRMTGIAARLDGVVGARKILMDMRDDWRG
ncbi:MAG: hypothetical protein AAF501_21035 [Pseudomonadota bacterium]